MITLLVIILLLVVAITYISIINLRKQEAFEYELEEMITDLETVNQFSVEIYESFEGLYHGLKNADYKGYFEADDEVGWVFGDMLSKVEKFKEQYEERVNFLRGKEDEDGQTA